MEKTLHIQPDSTDKPLVSVVLPLYNAGQHLLPCFDSLLSQTESHFELIIVADNPTDGSLQIAEDYASRDNRIHLVVNQQNQHIGLSRNIGLSCASAGFVVFCDHDDVCSPDMLALLLDRQRQTDADIVFSPVQTTVPDDPTNGLVFGDIAAGRRDFALRDLLSSGGSKRYESLFTPVLGNLYRTSLARSILFADTRVVSAEDKLFNTAAIHEAEHVDWIDSFVYTHVNHSANEGSSGFYRSLESRGKAMQMLLDMVHSWRDGNDYLPSLSVGLGKQALVLLVWSMKQSPAACLRTIRELRQAAWVREATSKDGMKRSVLKCLVRRFEYSLINIV